MKLRKLVVLGDMRVAAHRELQSKRRAERHQEQADQEGYEIAERAF